MSAFLSQASYFCIVFIMMNMFLKITGDMFRYKNLPTISIVITICIPLINLLVSMVFLNSTYEEATNYEFNKIRRPGVLFGATPVSILWAWSS
jgi:hypothetical protein